MAASVDNGGNGKTIDKMRVVVEAVETPDGSAGAGRTAAIGITGAKGWKEEKEE